MLRKEAGVGRREREEEGNEGDGRTAYRETVGGIGRGSESGVRWQCKSRHC